jgi:hypothetical protein
MIKVTIDVYDYSTNESFTVITGGYPYGPSTSWINTSSQIIGTNHDRDFTVRFGNDGGVPTIWIGELGSSWSYPQVVVREVMAGFSSSLSSWQGAWSIGFESTAFGTVNTTHTRTFPFASGLNAPVGSTIDVYMGNDLVLQFDEGA